MVKRIVVGVLAAIVVPIAALAAYIGFFGFGAVINDGVPVQGASAAEAGVTPVTVARGLENPWGLAFLPDGRMLVTEKPGRLRVVSKDGKVSPPIKGVPAVLAEGQGGLLDVAIDPAFADNRLIYLAYAEPDTANPALSGTAVARAKLAGTQLESLNVIFRQQPKVESSSHWGSRLLFANSEQPGRPYLFITTGDRYAYKDRAQDLTSHLGKVIRIYADGAIPADNPFVGQAGKRGEIWSYGHRNLQGMAFHPQTGALWTHEHGPRGGDELNIVTRGQNYGWPLVTFGRDYITRQPISKATTRADIPAALKTWIPSIAPSGLTFVTSNRYPAWKGNVLIGSLAHQQLVRLELDGDRVVAEHRLLRDLGERIRDVRQGPDGLIYLLTDSEDGRLLRLDP
jgi:aldose sugar dehydrogenase